MKERWRRARLGARKSSASCGLKKNKSASSRLEALFCALIQWTLRHFGNVRGLRAFLTLNDFELNAITFSERLKAAAGNRAVVNEDVRTAFARNEAESLRVIEPLHSAGDASH